MFRIVSFIFFGAGLLACSSVSKIVVVNKQIAVDTSAVNNLSIDSIIQPYRIELDKEMKEIVAVANVDFIVSRPCGNLNNWVTDALLNSQVKNKKMDTPVFCLINTGGIRSTINKGEVTLGDFFKVMPFDNLIVWVKMPISSLTDIEQYLKSSGGEPISGAILKNGKLEINGMKNDSNYFWVITSDYLFNGGDKMTFFKKNIEFNVTNVLMRNALISEAKEQKILIQDTINRIIL